MPVDEYLSVFFPGWKTGLVNSENVMVVTSFFLYLLPIQSLFQTLKPPVGDCWYSGKTNKDGFDEFFVSVKFEWSVFYNDQRGKITVSVNGVW